jgi:hypothetical protein
VGKCCCCCCRAYGKSLERIGKASFDPGLNWAIYETCVSGFEGIAPRILDLGTKLRWSVSCPGIHWTAGRVGPGHSDYICSPLTLLFNCTKAVRRQSCEAYHLPLRMNSALWLYFFLRPHGASRDVERTFSAFNWLLTGQDKPRDIPRVHNCAAHINLSLTVKVFRDDLSKVPQLWEWLNVPLCSWAVRFLPSTYHVFQTLQIPNASRSSPAAYRTSTFITVFVRAFHVSQFSPNQTLNLNIILRARWLTESSVFRPNFCITYFSFPKGCKDKRTYRTKFRLLPDVGAKLGL